MKDRELVDMTMDQVRRLFLESLTPEERLASIAGLDADQVLSRYKPEERLRGVPPEERLRGIPPEERLRDVPPEHAILALSDTMLAQLPETLLVELPEEIQAKVRARLGR